MSGCRPDTVTKDQTCLIEFTSDPVGDVFPVRAELTTGSVGIPVWEEYRYEPFITCTHPRSGSPGPFRGAFFNTPATWAASPENSTEPAHYGMFGLLDHRSSYGRYWFPEPFRLDETDVDNEIRVDWLHQAGHGHVTDQVSVELEKSFGVTTFELEIPYQRESQLLVDPISGTTSRDRTHGIGNIELSVRRPVYQFVSSDKFFDNTVGGGFELGIPTNSPVSKDFELVGKVFDALRLGNHFSLQSIAGYSVLIGPSEGGTRIFEYGAVAGWNLDRHDLPIPHVEQITPIVELKGERALNGEANGENDLSGTAGVRVTFDGFGPFQPRLGLGYVFPISQVARDDFKWGIVTSLVFEY
jgi:hypothetical protein